MAQTIPGGPAERAGLRGVDVAAGRLGDVIVAIEGEPVRRLADLTGQLERVGVGKAVTLTVQRDGADRSVTVDVVDIGER